MIEAGRSPRARPVDGVGFDALHAPLVVVHNHLPAADAGPEPFEDLIGEGLNFGNARGHRSFSLLVSVRRHSS